MPDEPLRATEVARRLAKPTKDLLRLIHERRIRYVMLDGIAHVPDEAVEEFRARGKIEQPRPFFLWGSGGLTYDGGRSN